MMAVVHKVTSAMNSEVSKEVTLAATFVANGVHSYAANGDSNCAAIREATRTTECAV